MYTLRWIKGQLELLDQTLLPVETTYIHCTDWRQVAEAIKMLRVRGAPAIGVAAAYAYVLAAKEAGSDAKLPSLAEKQKQLVSWAEELRSTRPTAINLMWAIDRMNQLLSKLTTNIDSKTQTTDTWNSIVQALEEEAVQIEKEDKALTEAMASAGADIFKGQQHLRIMTHCNAGALATAGIGTALGVIRELYKRGQLERVYADETRPLLQGSRLTTFELMEDKIPVTLQTDNMAAYAMQHGLIDAIIVGADRITAQGDVANKIGTYGVAVLAKYHKIPFYVAAPYSTFDLTLTSGNQIPIEMRDPDEVCYFGNRRTAPADVDVLNPAFDVTPHELIAGIITERGVLRPDFKESIQRMK